MKYYTGIIFLLIFVISCSKMEKKEKVEEQTPIQGEFSSEEVSESSNLEKNFNMDDFQKGKFGQYKIKNGDSLLTISFNIYGDYQKWKIFQHFNPGLNEDVIIPGKVLKYPLPKDNFVWRPKGNPYLILNGDSLTGISLKKYRDAMKWRKIWDNNKPLIKDPDSIFAGFTIFYVPDPKVIELSSLSQMGKVPVYKSELVAVKEKAEAVEVAQPEEKVVAEEELEVVQPQENIEVAQPEEPVKDEVEVVEANEPEGSIEFEEEVVEVKQKRTRAPASIGSEEPEAELSAEVLSNKLVPSEPSN